MAMKAIRKEVSPGRYEWDFVELSETEIATKKVEEEKAEEAAKEEGKKPAKKRTITRKGYKALVE